MKTVGFYTPTVLAQDLHFSIPVGRVKGFRLALSETNAAARVEGFKILRPHRAGSSNSMQHFILHCKDRRTTLVSELFGYIEDARNGRPFCRTSGSEKHW